MSYLTYRPKKSNARTPCHNLNIGRNHYSPSYTHQLSSSQFIKCRQNPIANFFALSSSKGSYSSSSGVGHIIAKISPPSSAIIASSSLPTRPISAMISLSDQLLHMRTRINPCSAGPVVMHIHLSSMSCGRWPFMRFIIFGPDKRMRHSALEGASMDLTLMREPVNLFSVVMVKILGGWIFGFETCNN
ncbi:hypothetical protein FOTG_14064 [Fusarium oxysporum f. sp. vasinfectum 25433]|uniref:Uncharacterized protein n=1 Tax=Fusarium oxysporum f. sp. vasinfectum 25433 TaxID=1089449 RepID=X0LA30_FUSOX|nr:hypothetical protein FOTG_14064 [Fusarium oxysporum f. sp. vasinfectum 25433]